VQKSFGRCGRSRFVQQTAFEIRRRSFKTCGQNAAHSHCNFAKLTFAIQGNQGRAQDTAKMTTRRKRSEGSAFWKNLLRRYCRVRRLPDNFLPEFPRFARDFGCGLTPSTTLRITPANRLNSGAGEGIRTPDPLITNQMLYRLSYASNWGKARLRANLSHGSLPDVRDNYIKYHSAKLGCNHRTGRNTAP
jgi:hypothetical protein